MSIKGNTVGNLAPRANWAQEDPDQADFILGKEIVFNNTEPKKLKYTDTVVAAADFAEDATHEDYPFRAAIALAAVSKEMIPEIAFRFADAVSGLYAPVADSFDGGVYIYAAERPAADVTIPAIILWRDTV